MTIGPDTTICQGGTATLHGPIGYGNYLWSTGASTPNINVTAAGDYWCQVSYPSGNLVVNGDFSSGNTGFSSQFVYSSSNVQNEGLYTVGSNASWYHNQFQGTGTGNFLIANGGYGSWLNNQHDVWCQTIQCCPGQTYFLGFRARTLSNALPARAVWLMDGVLAQWPDMTFGAYNAGWQPFGTTWTAGPGQTSVSACISLTSGDGVGDDFGIDDINISGTIVLRDTVRVHVTPLPTVDLGPDLALCAGETMDLDAGVAGGTYVWQDASLSPTLHVASAGNYGVTVTAQNCSNSDQVSITYNPVPVVNLGADTALCAGTFLQLNAFTPGCTYLWQNGSTGATFNVTGPGLYWAQVIRNNCSVRDSIVVTYKPLPTVSLGNDTSICAGASLTLDPAVAGAGYSWQDGSSAPNFIVSAGGTYQVIVDLDGCSASDAIQVALKPLPLVDLGPDTTVCPGSSVAFDGFATGATYLWSDGTTGSTLTTAVPGNYSVQVTVDGCSSSDAVILANFNLQAVSLGPDRVICAGESTMIGASVPGATYLWNTGASTDSISTSTAGTYWVDAILNGCSVRDSVEVSVTPLPVMDLGPDLPVCPGAQATLYATTTGGSYLWNNGAVTPTITVGAGTWSVDVTVNGCTASDALTITNLAPPTVELGPDQVVCPGDAATFDATTSGAIYLWSDGTTGPTLTTAVPGNYSVQVTVNGCSSSDAAILSNFNLQTVSLGPDRAICAGGSMMIGTSIPGATYLWNSGASSDSISVSLAGTYWLDVLLNGCAARDSIDISVTPLPVVALGADLALCLGDQATLDATLPGGSYLWSNGAITPTITVGTGTWSVGVTVNGCTGTDIANITNLLPPVVDLGPDTLLCPNASIVLNAGTNGMNYLWNTGATGQSITITAASTASITVTDAQGCSSSDAITISYASPLAVSLGPDIIVCAGEPVTLDASTPGASGYLWSNGTTDAVLNTTNEGTYTVSVTQGACATSDTITIQTVQSPSVTLGNDTTLCPGGTMDLHVSSPGSTFAWQDGSIGDHYLVNAVGDYWVVAMNAAGCADTASVHVAYLNASSFYLGADTTICEGTSLMLDADLPGGSTQWSGSISVSTPTVAASVSGFYIATTTVASCTFTDTISVSVLPMPVLDLGPDQGLCPGSSVQITANAPSVLWDDGTITSTRTIQQPGTYWAMAMDHGCSASDTLVVIGIPLPDLHLGPDTGLCATAMMHLNATVPGGSYLWNDGITAAQRSVTAGIWSVAVSALGCTASDTIRIIPLPSPTLALPSDTTLCSGQTWLIDVAQPGSDYFWSNGSTSPSLLVSGPNTYTVTVVRDGCSATATIAIAYMDLSGFSLGPDTVLCPGETLVLTVPVPGASVVWQDGSTAAQRTIYTAGAYTVDVAVDGCVTHDEVQIGFTPLAEPDLGGDHTLCAGDTALLLAPSGLAQALWNNGTTGETLTVTSNGTYSVVFSLDGCITSDTTHVIFLPVITHLDLGQDLKICPGEPLTLDATISGASYLWNDGSNRASLVVDRPGVYHVTVQGPCILAADTVLVTEGNCAPDVNIPNAFTPDGDDINDSFAPVVSEPVRFWSFSIFNRWGTMIFTTQVPGAAWDGKMNGIEAPVGVYVWDLHYGTVTDAGVVQKRLRGSVVLVR